MPYFINRSGKGTVTELNNRDKVLSMLLTHERMKVRGAFVTIFENFTFKLLSKKQSFSIFKIEKLMSKFLIQS
jgi:hypothetical protein